MPEGKIFKDDPKSIALPMPIETDRLVLRFPELNDAPETTVALHETWSQLSQWMGWARGEPQPLETTIQNYRKAAEDVIARTDLMVIGFERATGRFVLSTGLHRMNWELRTFEIGYWVRKSAQGKGYAKEAANALARYAFDVLEAQRVDINADDINESSLRVIEGLGFEETGHKKFAAILPTDKVVGECEYSIYSTSCLPPLNVTWPRPIK